MSFTAAEQAAMTRALALAATPGVPLGPNPRVGCVLLDDSGGRSSPRGITVGPAARTGRPTRWRRRGSEPAVRRPW